MVSLFALFGTALLLSVILASTSLTRMAMSWIGFSRPEADPVILTGVTACAVTVGRLVLTQLSCSLVRSRWVCEANRQNIDAARAWLEDRRGTTVGLMLAYAFSPFPSDYVFIAHGLTGVWLWLIGLPFFVGRQANCLTWTHIAQIGVRHLDEETGTDGACTGVYFIVSQVMFLALVYGFAKLDWQHLLQTKHLQRR